MEPRRYLRCLGQPGLFTPTGEPIRFRTKKHLALLVYLAVEARHSHRRDRLGELLWPKVTLAEARHSLATALSVLRPRLGPEVLESTRDQVVLRPGRITLDLDRLAAGDVLGTEVTEPLEVAAFLEGFDIPDASEFTLWKDRQQARLLPAIKDALIVLIDRCRRTGDSRQIEQLADRMLGLDELSEEAIRAKMEARAFAGDRLTALKIFEEWKDKLAEELGAVPSSLVEGMAVRLRRRGWERTTLTDIPTVPTDQWRGRPFIGRSAEYRVLYEGWEGMRKGVPGHAMVLGDSGVGKTTLVERLTTAAGLEGAAISRVQCYDLEREIPYATLTSLIHGLLDRPGVSATPPEALAELARTVPEVRRRFASIPPSGDSQGETARIRLTESFHQMLQAIAEEHPVILVVDDLHLADDASLAVLHLVMRRARSEAIVMMLIARPGELPGSPQAARLRDNAASLGIREVELSPLSEEDSRELLGSLVPPDLPQPSSSVRRTLLRAAGGFPMVLELLVQDWQTNGDQSLALAVDAMTAELGGGTEPSTTYRQILPRIVRSLDAATHNALNLAAVLGHRLNDLTIYDIIDLTLGQSMAALSQLRDLRVLRDGSHGLEFVNEMIRAQVYASVPSSVRKALHTCIADRLLSTEGRFEGGSGLEVAWHCIRAGRLEEATTYLLLGAREAISSGAPHAAERALSSALPNLNGHEQVEATLLLVEVLQEQGRWRESLDCLGALDHQALSTRRHEALVLTALAKMNLSTSSAHEIHDRLPELREIIRSCSSDRTRVRAGKAIAYLTVERLDRELAHGLLQLVDLIPVTDLDPDSMGQLALTRALLLYQAGDTAGSFIQVTAAIERLREQGAANLLTVQLYSGLGAIRCREGLYEEAVVYLDQALKMAHRLGNDTAIASITANLAICFGRLGRYEEQLQRVGKLTDSWGAELAGFVEIQLTYSVAAAHALLHRPRQALEAIARLQPRLGSAVPSWMTQAWLLWKADILLLAGHRAEAFSTAREALEGFAFQLQSTAFAGPFARWTALTADDHGWQRCNALVDAFVERLDTYDALDQVEILCAKHHLDLGRDRDSPTAAARLAGRLFQLPTGIRAQLAALEVLPLGTPSTPETGRWPADSL